MTANSAFHLWNLRRGLFPLDHTQRRRKKQLDEGCVEGANAIIALRCAQLSKRFDDYWEDRAAA